MRKRKLIKEVLNKHPEFENSGTMFFIKNKGHVLDGYYIDMQPRGCSIYRIRYPLFEKFPCLHFTYSDLLGRIHYKDINTNELGSEVLKLIEPITETTSLQDLFSYVQSSKVLMNRIDIWIFLGYSMVLLGDIAKAKELLVTIADSTVSKLDPIYRNDYKQVLEFLNNNDLDGAHKLIASFEAEMRSILKI